MRGFEKSTILIFLMMMISLLIPMASAALLEQDDTFEPIHQGVDFPVGWSDISVGFGPNALGYEMVYPAMNGGSEDEMAGNGPFPWVLFFGSSGETKDGYMDLTSEIVKRGYIVLVSQEMRDSNDLSEALEITETAYELMNDTNNSHTVILGGLGNVDVNHWSLAGHGVGAMSATALYPYWLASTDGNKTHGPSGIFGVGADFSSWGQQYGWFSFYDWQVPSPKTGFFITGTTDEVAPGSDAITHLQSLDDFSWQMMHLVGANHYQFQDTTSIFENDDGDATMSKDAQIELSTTHIVAYLDAALKGEHSRFRDAFNRPVSPSIVADSDSYVEEDLSSSDWLKVHSLLSVPENNRSMGPEDTVNLKMNWTLRNGSQYSQLPNEWNVTVQCSIASEQNTSEGEIDSLGQAVCLFPMQDVEPGLNRLKISVYVEGAPSHRFIDIFRTDAPLVLLTPAPIINVEQRGSTHVENGQIVYDPDGQSVYLDNAVLIGENSDHFDFQIDSDRLGFTIYHSIDEEWTGLSDIRLNFTAGGQIRDDAQTEITLRVMPVDDPAVLIKNIPLQQLEEDSSPLTLNLSDYVFDPEGEEIVGLINGNTSSQVELVSAIIEDGLLTITPLANQNGAVVLHLLVGDGLNVALNLDVPINILAIDDLLITNNSAWNISATEDESIRLPVSDFAYDLDDDLLIWSITGTPSSKCASEIVGDELIVTLMPDKFGICDSQTLEVSDGITSYSALLNISIASQPDMPSISIGNVNLLDRTAVTIQWDLIDLDGPQQPIIAFFVENVSQNVTSSCSVDESGFVSKCVTMLVLPQQHDGNITVTIRVTDLQLNQTIAAEHTVQMNQEIPTSGGQEKDSKTMSTQFMIGVGTLLVFAFLLLSKIVLSKPSGDSNAQLLRQQIEVSQKEIKIDDDGDVKTADSSSDGQEEMDSNSKSGSTGLLARAKKI